jgi:hypothetical protein
MIPPWGCNALLSWNASFSEAQGRECPTKKAVVGTVDHRSRFAELSIYNQERTSGPEITSLTDSRAGADRR